MMMMTMKKGASFLYASVTHVMLEVLKGAYT